ncbi:MAG TPA: class I SAM-dependent methyltransferase [Geothrix sp.]|nr:class I SAM-dependent methyltransferase [Geothrix sp.]
MKCRHCHAELSLTFLDLGAAPHSNAYLTEQTLHTPESWFPLKVLVCTSCWLVQTEDLVAADDLFNDQYAYFSSYSDTWLKHAKAYVASMVDRFQLNAESHVVELAANDGYLLQFVKARSIPCLGIEPTHGTAEAAREKGIEILEAFFGETLGSKLAASGKQADLITANNVLAHVPDINDFLRGVARLLKPDGVATFEFPHLLELVENSQFDTIYHEHFSYLSMTALARILLFNNLRAFDLDHLSTHGGSLRVYVQRSDASARPPTVTLEACLAREAKAGICAPDFYQFFQNKANTIKNTFIKFLMDANATNKTVAAYGAAAKGNTLLNYAGIRPDLLPFVVDRNPAKQGKFLPGSRIPICHEAILTERKPDFVVILPWNLKAEVIQQLAYIRQWGGRFVTAVPMLSVE